MAFANPYLMCLECRCRVTDVTGNENVPCGHTADYEAVCPSWSPVDGCTCDEKATLGVIGYYPHVCEPPKHYVAPIIG